jgi:hypothetical protein
MKSIKKCTVKMNHGGRNGKRKNPGTGRKSVSTGL